MLPRNHLDHITVAFDDHRLVAKARVAGRISPALPWACPNWLTGART